MQATIFYLTFKQDLTNLISVKTVRKVLETSGRRWRMVFANER